MKRTLFSLRNSYGIPCAKIYLRSINFIFTSSLVENLANRKLEFRSKQEIIKRNLCVRSFSNPFGIFEVGRQSLS